MTVKEVMTVLEELAPLHHAEDFDNVGVYTNFDGGRRVPLQHFEVMGRGSTGFRTSNFINVTSG